MGVFGIIWTAAFAVAIVVEMVRYQRIRRTPIDELRRVRAEARQAVNHARWLLFSVMTATAYAIENGLRIFFHCRWQHTASVSLYHGTCWSCQEKPQRIRRQ